MTKQLLILDDDAAHRMLIRRALTSLLPGFLVHECRSIPELNQLCKSDSFAPDLALIDLDLGGESGIDALKILRALNRPPTPHMVILSTSALPAEVAASHAAGAAFHLTKPADLSGLCTLLKTTLQALKLLP